MALNFEQGQKLSIFTLVFRADVRFALVQKSRHMAYSPELPYNDLPVLPPKAEVETTAILKKNYYRQPCPF